MAGRSFKSNPVKPPINTTEQPIITHEEIARRAYSLWMESGSPIGTDEENWLRAENELRTRQGVQTA